MFNVNNDWVVKNKKEDKGRAIFWLTENKNKKARKEFKMDSKINIWDKQQQNWIKEILSKSGTELKEISDKNGNEWK